MRSDAFVRESGVGRPVTLEVLLHHIEAKTLIIAGMATESCVLFTANDAYLRDYRIIVPADCVASARREDSERALK